MGKLTETRPLILVLQQLIENTFDMESGIQDASRYVLGDRGVRKVYGRRKIIHFVEGLHSRAMLLVREEGGAVLANIYYPDKMIRKLEEYNPLVRLDERNIDEFLVFTEELDHLLTLGQKRRRGEEATLLEMELHSNVTKELAAKHFIGRQASVGDIGEAGRRWVRFHVFEKFGCQVEDGRVRGRYNDAARYAVRYLDHLHSLLPRERIKALRRFDKMSPPVKIRFIESLN